jgi:PIN domain nuclease of toxin-antitoxin system
LRLLLDTCTFLWLVDDESQLSEPARRLMLDAGNEVFLSAVSAWEIAVKQGLGRLVLSEPALHFVPKYRDMHRVLELPLDETAALQINRLPATHKDPFDRMLVCQAIAHGLILVTPDPQISRYPVRVLW